MSVAGANPVFHVFIELVIVVLGHRRDRSRPMKRWVHHVRGNKLFSLFCFKRLHLRATAGSVVRAVPLSIHAVNVHVRSVKR